MKITSGIRRAIAALTISTLLLPQALWAQSAVDDSPNEWAMVGDLLVARPVGAVMTAGGAAVWLVCLPFTLLAGHAAEAADTLIVGPGEATFMRCLGCRNTGYTNKDVEIVQSRREGKAEEEAARLGLEPVSEAP
jgi:hypothetical protein